VGLSFELPVEGLLIGRDASQCRLCLDEPTWSAQHARVVKLGDAWQITALSRQGGVWVNQQTCNVGQSLLLTEGQRLQLGHVQLAFTQAPIAATSATVSQPASQQWVGSAAALPARTNQVPAESQPASRAVASSGRATASVSSGRKMQAFAAVSQAPVSAHHATEAFNAVPESAGAEPNRRPATQGMLRPPTLRVQSGPSRGQVVPVTGPLTIGSQPGCSWLIQDPSIAA